MDDSALVRELTSRGIIVTRDVLERAKSGGIGSVAGHAKKKAPAKVYVRIHRVPARETMAVREFGEHYTKRFEALREMLLKRTSAVSISNAKESSSPVSVIGMVRERTSNGFLVEDNTGDLGVVSGEAVAPDEVVAVTGRTREGLLIAESIERPGIPEQAVPGKPPGLMLLLTTFMDQGLRESLGGFDVVIAPENSGIGGGEKIISDVPNPGKLSVFRGESELRVLLYRPPEPCQPEDPVRWLEARHLLPGTNEIISVPDPFLIDPVPHIFWVISGERRVAFHRGVSIIMSRENDAVRVDTSTGKAYFAHDTKQGSYEEGK